MVGVDRKSLAGRISRDCHVFEEKVDWSQETVTFLYLPVSFPRAKD